MEKILLEELTAKTRALMEAPTCSAEAKAAAQRWLDAVGTDAESEARESYIAELIGRGHYADWQADRSSS